MTWVRFFAVLEAGVAVGCSPNVRGPCIGAAQCNIAIEAAVPSTMPTNNLRPGGSALDRLDKCAEPLRPRQLSTDEALMERALDLPPTLDVLLVLHSSPWRRQPGTLLLRKTSDGAYFLRSTRLSANAWIQMRSSGIAKVLESRTVHERVVDYGTAQLLLGYQVQQNRELGGREKVPRRLRRLSTRTGKLSQICRASTQPFSRES